MYVYDKTQGYANTYTVCVVHEHVYTCTCSSQKTHVGWISNLDTVGPEKKWGAILISRVEKYTNMVYTCTWGGKKCHV